MGAFRDYIDAASKSRIFVDGLVAGTCITSIVWSAVLIVSDIRRKKHDTEEFVQDEKDSTEEAVETQRIAEIKSLYDAAKEEPVEDDTIKAHIVSENEVGMNPDLSTVYLQYTADGKLMRRKDYALIEDFVKVVGIDPAKHFDEDPENPDVVVIEDPVSCVYWVVMRTLLAYEDIRDELKHAAVKAEELGYYPDGFNDSSKGDTEDE